MLLYASRFLPRDAMHNAAYVVARCPSICSSHAGIVLKPLNISSIFLPSCSHTTPVSPYQTLCQYFNKDPLTGASNAGGTKNRDFRPIYRFISEMIQDSDIVMRIGNHIQAFE